MDLLSNISAPSITSSLNAALVITELDPGGAEKAFARIAIGLKSLGWNVSVYSLREVGLAADAIQQSGISVTPLHGFRFDPRAIIRLGSAFRRQRPHVVLSFLHEANLISRIAARIARVPVQISGIRVADRRLSVAWPERLTSKLVTHYVAVSQNVADVHAAVCGIARDRISVIYNGVDPPPPDPCHANGRHTNAGQTMRPADAGGNRRETVLFVGRLTPQKAPQDLLDAYRQLPAAQQALCELVFVGDGPLRSSLEEEARRWNLPATFLGWRPDVWKLMSAASVLVLPSRWEGLPNVILEAMATRLPVISARIDGVSELITDGETGRLFTPGRADELAAQLSEHLRDPQRGQTLADAAQGICLQRFTWSAASAAYDRLMRSLVRPDVIG